ncbi:hypothetical protein F1559_000494 [Cyanidiococcus yangmingshanensis]|uniref:Uncharacterized protein n=1 Tax=Cyanidiococcus yangmingshanensis TaxID=2690220 RepID=A0A7J7ICE8_9RHOD|nr:hypothetical protein F1559_000494 [Cyanidiococcus yangmingshanensis]
MNRDPLPQAPAERPEDWLPTAERAGYGTQYRHFRSALMFQIRSVPSGPDRLVVTGFAIEEPERVGTLSLRISDYIRTHVWEQAQTTKTTPLDWSALVQGWQRLATLVQVDLVHTLIPDSAKDGYEPRASPLPGTNTGGVHNGGQCWPRHPGATVVAGSFRRTVAGLATSTASYWTRSGSWRR